MTLFRVTLISIPRKSRVLHWLARSQASRSSRTSRCACSASSIRDRLVHSLQSWMWSRCCARSSGNGRERAESGTAHDRIFEMPAGSVSRILGWRSDACFLSFDLPQCSSREQSCQLFPSITLWRKWPSWRFVLSVRRWCIGDGAWLHPLRTTMAISRCFRILMPDPAIAWLYAIG